MKSGLSSCLVRTTWLCLWTGSVLSICPQSSGQMVVGVRGAALTSFSIQATTNLCAPAWVTLVSTNTDTNGVYDFVDQDAANYPCRFYRSVTGFGYAGLKAKGFIRASGGYFDSYNSSLGAYNPTNHGTNGIVLTDTNISGAINLYGGTDIFGLAITGPGGSVTLNSGSGVGSPAWIAAQGGSGGLQPGWTSNDANYQFNDVSAPSFSSFLNSFTLSGTTNIAGVTGTTSYYEVPTILISISSSPLLVYGNTTIYCTQTGNNVVVVQGNGFIKLMPGASLTLYTAGNAVISGSGIVNSSAIPSDLHIYGLPTCTSVTYSGSTQFYGVVDVPDAAFTYNSSADAFGDFTANSINHTGGAAVHADEALSSGGVYMVVSRPQ